MFLWMLWTRAEARPHTVFGRVVCSLRLIGVDGCCSRKKNVWLLQAVVVVVVGVGYGYYSFFVVRQNSAKLLPCFFCFALAIDDAMRWDDRALIQRALNQRASSSSPRVLPLPAQAVFPVQLSWVEKILKKFWTRLFNEVTKTTQVVTQRQLTDQLGTKL